MVARNEHTGRRPMASSGDKIQTKETTKAYRDNYDLIFKKDTCNCTMSKALLGDGCSVCNPSYMEDILAEEEVPYKP